MATNAASALLATLCVLILRDLERREQAPGANALALAFAFVPGVWIASTTTIDYLWSLAPILLALRAAVRRRPTEAGVWLGLAIACRATGLLALIPVAVLLERRGRCVATALALGGIAYLPVLANSGWRGLLPHLNERPPWSFAMEQGTLGLLGEVGTLALLVAVAAALRRRDPRGGSRLRRAGAWLTALYVGLYLCLPFEGEYLLPALAGLWIWLGPRIPARLSLALPIAFALSALVGITRPAPLLRDRATRIREVTLGERVARAAHTVRRPTALICGRMYPKVRYALGGHDVVGDISLYVSLQDEGRIRRLLGRGVDLRYVRGTEGWYVRRTGIHLERFAKPFP